MKLLLLQEKRLDKDIPSEYSMQYDGFQVMESERQF